MTTDTKLRAYHAAVWDEPVVMTMGRPGACGQVFTPPQPQVAPAAGTPASRKPAAMRRAAPPALPEITEFEAQRHYLHLSQMTLGMMGVSLFGTCTMKYNAKLSEMMANRPELAEVHPLQHEETLQGSLGIMHELDLILRSLSGMDQFIFQPGGGADAAYTMTAVCRAYWAAKGELGSRDEVVTSIQAHPCNPATAAAAGFKVINLPLEENGYPSLEALEAALGPRTAMLMIGNPDDMGIYNPEIKRWVAAVKAVGALC
jgi:glycine dehydrogenase subunit 2